MVLAQEASRPRAYTVQPYRLRRASTLRNAGLIKEHPEGWLTSATEIEITTLGKLLLEAKEKQ
jgi:hypothetical protein